MSTITTGKVIIYKPNFSIIKVDTLLDLPVVGEENTLYLVVDTGDIYLWNGVSYSTASVGADHGGLNGLADDDHLQYHNDTRGDARYAPLAKGVTNGDTHDHNGGDGAQIDHGGLAGLSDDDHSQYTLLAGRATGQILYGGIAANEDITIVGTSNATKTTSYVILQPTGGNVGIGTTTPTKLLEVNGDALISTLTIGKGTANIATNTAIGYQTLVSNSTGNNNTAIGYSALISNTTGATNTAVGVNSLYTNISGIGNTAIGHQSMYFNDAGTNNTAIGYYSMLSNLSGGGNTAIGYQSLFSNTLGSNSTAVGLNTLYTNSSGANNSAVGLNSMLSNTIGSENTGIGSGTIYTNSTGSSNTAVGFNALYYNTIGASNTAVGGTSLIFNTIGINNTAIGFDSGRYVTGGGNNEISSNSVYLGYSTKASADGNVNEIVIGYLTEGLGSNTVTLGNASILNTYLRGGTGVNTTSVNASAQLQVDSTTKGFLPPRMTATQASAIGTPAEGLMVYVTDTNGTFLAKGWYGYDGAAWQKLNN